VQAIVTPCHYSLTSLLKAEKSCANSQQEKLSGEQNAVVQEGASGLKHSGGKLYPSSIVSW
jgi:hypothetical protein